MSQRHVDSYYAATALPQPDRPTLQGAVTADVCVVGAGYTGISTALHLAERGYQVVVLEAAVVGFGASGRNGGQLVNSYSRDIDVIERRHGAGTARALGAMMFEGGDIIRDRIARYAIDCHYRPGALFAAVNRSQLRHLTTQQSLWRRYGNEDLQLFDRRELAGIVASDRYLGGLLDRRSGHVHPLRLVQGEAAAFEALGGRIFQLSPVSEIAHEKDRAMLETTTGRVTARYAVLAGNAYLGRIVPKLASASMPCGTQIVTTEPLGEAVARELLPTDCCVEDCNYLLDYFRTTSDHRLLFGGGVHYGGGDPADIEAFLRPRLETVFPRLKGVRIDYRWGGDFLLTLSRLPQLGRLGTNVYYAQGYSGHGVCTSHLAGRLLAEAIDGQATRFDAFAALPHLPFPGGRRLRAPLTALAAAWYSLRDRLAI